MPARRRSSCRHSHGVGTSLTVATRAPQRSAKAKSGRGVAADQQERVAGHRLAEADEVAIARGLVELVDPHRPAPGDIDGAVEEPVRRLPPAPVR